MKRLLKGLFGAGALFALGCLGWGFGVEPRLLAERQMELGSPQWSGENFTVAFITDFHIGGLHVDSERVERIAAQAMKHKPDLILLGGDFINGHVSLNEHKAEAVAAFEAGIAALDQLSAPLGVYAVIGNHDIWLDTDWVIAELAASGVTTVVNDSAVLDIGGTPLCLIGLDDEMSGEPSYSKARRDCPKEAARLILSHAPDSVAQADESAIVALAGHTHGGQINPFFFKHYYPGTQLGKDFAYGWEELPAGPIYISSGIGTSIMPARFRAVPEIVILTLSAE